MLFDSVCHKFQRAWATGLIVGLLLLCILLAGVRLYAQSEGRRIAFISRSNAGFAKDAFKELKQDARRTRTNLTLKSLDELLSTNLSGYTKVAVMAYISDIQGPLLEKLRSLQSKEPNKFILWLAYRKKASPLPSGIDAATSASREQAAKNSYGRYIRPHLF